jgi:hypothetical protein
MNMLADALPGSNIQAANPIFSFSKCTISATCGVVNFYCAGVVTHDRSANEASLFSVLELRDRPHHDQQ